MTEETTTTLTGQGPPVPGSAACAPDGTEADPVPAEPIHVGPLTRIRLPHGKGVAWLATRYEDVRLITGDPRFSRAEVTDRRASGPHAGPRPGSLAWADPSEHDRLSKQVAGAFSAAAMKRMRPRARRVLGALVDGLLADGPPADLLTRVLEPFPVIVVSEVMGVPVADREQVHSWARRILAPDGPAGEEAERRLYDWIAQTIRGRAHSTGDDVYSLLGAAVSRGEIDEEEAAGLAGPLQLAGETVTGFCGRMFLLLLTRPELMERARDAERRGPLLDELLRYVPHRGGTGPARVALDDVDVHGVRVARGDRVYVSYPAACRDPAVFPDPDRVYPARAPNPHLAFGNGPHSCTGALLARMQTDLLVDTLPRRLPGLRLAVPPDEIPRRDGTAGGGPRALPCRWD